MIRIFYIHIPKCAGTTLHHIIEQQYEPEEIYTVPSVAWNAQNFWSLRTEWPEEKKAKIRVVKGHMHYGWHHAFPKGNPHAYITMLRDPWGRVNSLHRHVMRDKSHFLHRMLQRDILDFLHVTGNEMVSYISGIPRTGDRVEDFALAMAKAHLKDSFSFVGFVWDFDESVDRMRRLFGWKPIEYEPLNASETGQMGISYDLFKRYNELDIELYKYAREEFPL